MVIGPDVAPAVVVDSVRIRAGGWRVPHPTGLTLYEGSEAVNCTNLQMRRFVWLASGILRGASKRSLPGAGTAPERNSLGDEAARLGGKGGAGALDLLGEVGQNDLEGPEAPPIVQIHPDQVGRRTALASSISSFMSERLSSRIQSASFGRACKVSG